MAQSNGKKDTEHGEGSYKGTRDYNQRTKEFIDSGRVEQAAHDAEPKNREEARDMERAEEVGRSRARGSDAGTPRGSERNSEVNQPHDSGVQETTPAGKGRTR